MMRQSFAACVCLLLLIAARSGGAQPRSGTFDLTAGKATVRGPRVPTLSSVAVDVTLARRWSRFGRAGGGIGIRTGSGNGDVCFLDPADDAGCLERVPGHANVVALGGVGVGDGTGELRLLAGPLLMLGGGNAGLGGAVAADIAVGGERAALVLGARVTAAQRRQNGRVSSSQVALGLRLR